MSTRDEVILVLDDILEVLDFAIPRFTDSTSRLGHFGHTSEGISPSVEVVDKGLSLSLVFGDFTLKDTSTNGIAGNGSWWEDDTGGATTINLGSHVFFPVVELAGFTVGGFSESVGDLLHLGLNLDQGG